MREERGWAEVILLVGGPWKSNVVLEKFLKMVEFFCMNSEANGSLPN